MRIEIDIDRINYEDLVAALIPKIGDEAEKKSGLLGRLIKGRQTSRVSRKLLGRVPERTKNEYAVKLINKYADKIAYEIEKGAMENEVRVKVKNIRAK